MRRLFITVSFVFLVSFFLSLAILSCAQKSSNEIMGPLDTDAIAFEKKAQEEESLRKKIDKIVLNKKGIINNAKIPQAIKHLDEYLARNPKSEFAYIMRFQILFSAGQIKEALEAANMLIEINPKCGNHYICRAQCFMGLGQMQKAEADLKKVLEFDQDPAVREEVSQELEKIADRAEGKTAGEILPREIVDDDQMTQEERSLCKAIDEIVLDKDGNLNNARIPQAIKHLDEYLARNPKSEFAYILRFQIFFSAGQIKEAIKAANMLIKLNPKCGEHYICRAQCFMGLGQMKKAEADLKKVLESDQDPAVCEEAYLGLARIYRYDEHAKFFEVMKKLAEINPSSVPMHVFYGETYALWGEIDKAKEHFDAALELDPGNAEIYVQRGGLFGLQREFDKALKDLDTAVEYNPDYDLAYIFRFRIYCIEKDYEKALSNITSAIAVTDLPDYYFERAKFYYFFLSDTLNAMEDIAKALELDPDNYEFGVFRDYLIKE